MHPPPSPSSDGLALVAPGAVVDGRYRIEQTLGQGGMGVVVRATHVELGGAVALKFLHRQFADDADAVERFMREARAASRIKSEHVARVFDVGRLPTGEPFLVMELLVGDDLHRVSRQRGPLPQEEAVSHLLQACHAIAEAHRHGIVHRDLKPANLFLTRREDGTPLVKVLDFGISKQMSGSEESLTATGDVLGSPVYMSPEQIRNSRSVDARADIWALGNILYKLLAGRAPFAADTSAATLARIIADPAPPLRAERPDVSPELEAIVLRCLEKDPARRYQRVEELVSALARPSERAPEVTPPASPMEAKVNAPSSETTSATSVVTAQRLAPRGSVLVAVLGVLLTTAAFAGIAFTVARRAPAAAGAASVIPPAAPVPAPPAASSQNPPVQAAPPPEVPPVAAPSAPAPLPRAASSAVRPKRPRTPATHEPRASAPPSPGPLYGQE